MWLISIAWPLYDPWLIQKTGDDGGCGGGSEKVIWCALICISHIVMGEGALNNKWRRRYLLLQLSTHIVYWQSVSWKKKILFIKIDNMSLRDIKITAFISFAITSVRQIIWWNMKYLEACKNMQWFVVSYGQISCYNFNVYLDSFSTLIAILCVVKCKKKYSKFEVFYHKAAHVCVHNFVQVKSPGLSATFATFVCCMYEVYALWQLGCC